MENLISMTDFVLSKKYTATGHENYAKFLKQPLELWMLVPCDEAGNVLKEPEYYLDNEQTKKDYYFAKERCLFDGWNLMAKTDITICIENESKHRLFFPNCMTIENIVYTNSQLTKTAEKLIGL